MADEAFRSFRRAENAFCEGNGPPFLMKERARDAIGPSGLTAASCLFPLVILREESFVPEIE